MHIRSLSYSDWLSLSILKVQHVLELEMSRVPLLIVEAEWIREKSTLQQHYKNADKIEITCET